MRTAYAKTLYRIGALLSRIKTYQQTYSIPNMEAWFKNPVGEIQFEKAGRVWLPCHLSTKFLKWALNVDPYHFDHWALVHSECNGRPCPECKGTVCGNLDFDEVAE